MSHHDLRSRKEAFVTGHAGTTWTEVQVSCALPILLVLLRQDPYVKHWTRSLKLPQCMVDLLFLIAPLIAAWTGLGSPVKTAIGLTTCLAALGVLRRRSSFLALGGQINAQRCNRNHHLRDSLTAYRASLVLTTCICILAVDFPAFPRRFAKAEDYGTGSFVAASALTLGSRRWDKPKKLSKSDAVHAALLGFLGIVRLVSTSSIDYQSHASEYGIHWNFFFTLCTLRALQWLLDMAGLFQRLSSAGLAGGAILIIHQIWLQLWDAISYLHTDERDPFSIFSANKEGLGSLPGYVSLHLLCLCLGGVLGKMLSQEAINGEQDSTNKRVNKTITFLAIALQAAFLSLNTWVQPVSRRACNATYVVWMLALNVQVILGYYWAFSHTHMLAVFLAANLLTGAINMTFNTLEATDWTARAVLLLYMAALLGIAAVLSSQRTQSRETNEGSTKGTSK